jgi:multidrug efflux pump subunit AcrA (membrane-fusion protein)
MERSVAHDQDSRPAARNGGNGPAEHGARIDDATPVVPVTADAADTPPPPHIADAEQAAVWRRARATRWYHRTSIRLLVLLAVLVGALAVVPWPLYVTADCVIIPSERAYVRSAIAGEIAEILVDEGTRVRKGDVIARLDDRHLVAEREKAAADIARIEAELAQLQRGNRKEEIARQRAILEAKTSDVRFARTEADRRRKMYAEGVASSQALTAARHEVRVKEAARTEAAAVLQLLLAGSRPEEIAVAEAQRKRARAELVYIEQKLSDMVVIRSPIDGVVLTSRFRERLHEHVEAGGLVCEIANLATVRAEIFVPEREADSLAVGRPVTVKVESYPTHPFAGKVDFIAPSVERSDKTNTVRVIVALDNREGRLKQDMHGYGEIDCGDRTILQVWTRRLVRWIRVRFLI